MDGTGESGTGSGLTISLAKGRLNDAGLRILMKKLVILLIAICSMSGIAQAISFNIEVGDQPYYLYGPRYWARGAYWCWVPGHWRWRHGYKVWIHGHYRPC